MKRRIQRSTERDADSLRARHDRAKSPAVEFVDEECTGRYHGPDLDSARVRRAESQPAKRIALIEAEQKLQAERTQRIELAVVEIAGDQKAQNASLTAITKTLDRMAARADVEHAADVDVEASQKKDAIAARAEKRALALKALGLLLGGGVIGKVGNMLGLW